MSSFPTGVAVVTAIDGKNSPCGMTCSSMTSVTLRPPTLLVCLRLGSATCAAVLDSGAFGVNLLRSNARRAAELFSEPVADRFGQVRWSLSRFGHPWLVDDALAMAECVVTRSVEMGDHAVVFGQVQHVLQTTGTPLLYGMRRFSSWCPTDCADPAPRGDDE